jgi:hypothetical protein
MIKFENAQPAAPATAAEKAARAKKLAAGTGASETGETTASGPKKRNPPAAKPAKDAKAPQSDLLDL